MELKIDKEAAAAIAETCDALLKDRPIQLPACGHLMDYVRDIHIIVGPNGMCRCGEDGITCSERLGRVSHEIHAALIGAQMAKRMGGEKLTPEK